MVTSRVLVHPYAISWVSLDTLWRSYGGFQNDGTVNGKFHLVGASKGCRGIRQGMYKFSTCQVWNEKGHRPTLPVTSTSPPLGGSLAGFHHRLTFISRKYCDSVSGGSFFKRHPFGNVAHSPYIPHYCCFLYGYCRKDPWDAQETGFKLSGTSLRMSSTTTRILTDKSKCSIVALNNVFVLSSIRSHLPRVSS